MSNKLKPVYTEEQEKKYQKVLQEIQASIPAGLLKYALSEKKLTPTIEFVLKKALESDQISEEKKALLRAQLESGEFSRMTPAENPKYTKQIDNYVNREINKAIKSGRLPPKHHVNYFPSLMKMRDGQQAKNLK